MIENHMLAYDEEDYNEIYGGYIEPEFDEDAEMDKEDNE